MAGKKKASKKGSISTAKVTATPQSGVSVPRSNVGATVQAMIAEGATSVVIEEATATTWVVTRLA